MVDKKILAQYKPHDKVIVFHEDDPNLRNITIQLPDPPPLETIDGYGLPAKEQKFRVQKMPARLQRLIDKCETVEEVWQEMERDQKLFEEEITWVKKQWRYRLYGYWCFIDGKPTFIDGWHHFYLNNFHLDVGLPDYRDRDRKFFIFARYCYTTKEAFYKYRIWNSGFNKWYYTSDRKKYEDAVDGNVKCEAGDFLIDLNFRTVFGFNYPKHRRDGATYKCLNILLEMGTRTMSDGKFNYGIQSMDGASAEKYFLNQLVPAWQKLPFYYQAKHDGTTSPKEKISLAAPSKRQGEKKGLLNKDKQLGVTIGYATTADRGYYDGDKLFAELDDENGKTTEEDIVARWQVKRQCHSQGNGAIIHGFSMHPTTVAENTTGGGQNFYLLCEDSMWDDRIDHSGQTRSGLINFFMPAWEGMEGFIGPYGESIIETPTPEQAEFIGRTIGAKEFLLSNRRAHLAKNTPESLKVYREMVRQFPIYFHECFRSEAGEAGFNLEIIEQRMDQLRFDRHATVQGNFEWEDDKVDGRVIWVPNSEGRWKISLTLPVTETNLKHRENGHFFPSKSTRFTACGDAFNYDKVESHRMSDGGGAVFWHRDLKRDPDEKDIKLWESHRFVCSYLNRPATTDEYAEDMLMMCVYYGALMYPEMNVPVIQKHFERRKYGGYLKYDFDDIAGVTSKNPGFNTKVGHIKQDLFNAIRDYIEKHGMRERHFDILDQCKSIKGLEELTNYDLFTAAAGALVGSDNGYGGHIEEKQETQTMTLDQFFPLHKYAS